MAEAKATREIFAKAIAATATDNLDALLDEFVKLLWEKNEQEKAREDEYYQGSAGAQSSA